MQTVHTIGQGHTTREQAGRRRGIAPDSEANGDKVAAQGAPSLALGMVTLEVPKVSQVRRTRDGSGNRAGTNTDRMDKRDTNKKKKNLQTITRGKQLIKPKSKNKLIK